MKKILFVLLVLGASCNSGREKLLSTIRENEKKLFSDTLKKLDTAVAAIQVGDYRAYAEKYPTDSLSPEFLFKAADIANGLGHPEEAMELLESLRKTYPAHARAGTSLFLEAFIYETSMRDNKNAIAKYTEFLEKYPDHQLAQAAQFSLLQLQQGMSVEDVVKMFEAKNDSTAGLHQ
jgi:TolA-binding protein